MTLNILFIITGIFFSLFSCTYAIMLVRRNHYLKQHQSQVILKIKSNHREGLFSFIISALGLIITYSAFKKSDNAFLLYVWYACMFSYVMALISSLSSLYILDEGILFSNHLVQWSDIEHYSWKVIHTDKYEKLTLKLNHIRWFNIKSNEFVVPSEDKNMIERSLKTNVSMMETREVNNPHVF